MLRIFKGKQAKYNKLILKAILSGAETTTQIAEYIFFNRGSIHPAVLNKLELKTIISVISRKTGGLATLKKWHYIYRNKNGKEKWDVTDKGFPVALTCFDTIGEFLALHTKEFSEITEKVKVDTKEYPFIAEAEEFFLEPTNREHAFGILRDATRKLIEAGVDLDSLSVIDAKNLLTAQQVMLMASTEFARKKSEVFERAMSPTPNRKTRRQFKKRLEKVK